MRQIGKATLGGIIGAGILVALAGSLPPASTIAIGGFVAFIATFALRGKRAYAWAGSTFAVASAVALLLAPSVPEAYLQTPMIALLAIGLLSFVIVVARLFGRVIVVKLLGPIVGRDRAASVWRFFSSAAGTVLLVLGILSGKDLVKHLGVPALAGLTFVLEIVGISPPVPVPGLSYSIDSTMFLFVGASITWFHLLETLEAAWFLSKQSAKAGTSAAGKAKDKATDKIEA